MKICIQYMHLPFKCMYKHMTLEDHKTASYEKQIVQEFISIITLVAHKTVKYEKQID